MSTASQSSKIVLEELLDVDYVNESHIQSFSEALHAEESPELNGEATPSASPRIRKVSALSDFAPVNLRVKRSVHKSRHTSCNAP